MIVLLFIDRDKGFGEVVAVAWKISVSTTEIDVNGCLQIEIYLVMRGMPALGQIWCFRPNFFHIMSPEI